MSCSSPWLHRQCVGDMVGGRPGTTTSIAATAKAPMEHCLVTVWFMTFANTHTVCRWLFVAIPRRIIAVALCVGGVGHLGVAADLGDVLLNAMASAFNMGACTSPGVHSARGCLLEQRRYVAACTSPGVCSARGCLLDAGRYGMILDYVPPWPRLSTMLTRRGRKSPASPLLQSNPSAVPPPYLASA